ncbi:MAG: murC [Acidimicrobiales bacterium]|nr:murC [Acidimicrobiales bacterium]
MADPPPDLSYPRRIHLVGAGGAGISAIGLVLVAMGHHVTGTDVVETAVVPELRAAGIDVAIVGADDLFAAAAGRGPELIAHSTAFPPSPADQAAAEALGAEILTRACILAGICATRRTVAVSGTHGKTSTTAMVATMLAGADADPSFLVGAAMAGGGGPAARWTDSPWFVVEADESDGTFLALGAEAAVVTNVDEDHLDHWGTLDEIERGFDRFLAAATTRVVCIDDPARDDGQAEPRALRLARAHSALTVGEAPEAEVRISELALDRLSTSFRLHRNDADLGTVQIAAPGRHNARNAATAVATGLALGFDAARCRDAVGAFRGTARRFEVVGEAGGVTVVDDYAHNPGKVGSLLRSTRDAGWDRVVAVFQPHRYTRTRDQSRGFGAALGVADLLVITDVYGAGEQPLPGVTGKLLVDAVLDEQPQARVAWLPRLDDVVGFLAGELRPGDLCLTVGAGDVGTLGPRLLARLAASATGPVRDLGSDPAR